MIQRWEQERIVDRDKQNRKAETERRTREEKETQERARYYMDE